VQWGNMQTPQQYGGRHRQENLSASSEVCTQIYSAQTNGMHDEACLNNHEGIS
jgi:hypothetical protein